MAKEKRLTKEERFVKDLVEFSNSNKTPEDIFNFTVACYRVYAFGEGLTFKQVKDLIDLNWKNPNV